MNQDIWIKPAIIEWSQLLLNSYNQLLGRQLIERNSNPEKEAEALFFAPMVIVSHGKEINPILNYGNQTALNLWEMSWEEFTQTPSKKTVNSLNSEELKQRSQMLEEAQNKGFIENYRGVRVSRTRKQFLIENAIIWNVIASNNQKLGQAATFSSWTYL